MRFVSFGIFLALLVSKISAQDAFIFPPNPEKRIIESVKINGALKVDGKLNEDFWKQAVRHSNFTQVEPHQGERANHQTSVSVLYNQQFLYLAVVSKDSLGKKAIRAVDFKRDFDFQKHDLINLCFDGFRDERNAMVFATNPYGVQRDLLAFDDNFFDVDWDGLWRVRTGRSDSGWVAEIAIPWQTLRYPKMTDSLQTWGFNMYRNRRYSNEVTAFSPFPRVFGATRMSYAGLITNLQPPPPGANVRIQPYALFSIDRYRTPSTGEGSREVNFKPGGDIKWAVNTNTVLDLTVNTDFAQADVDRQVNNVTRFSVFFPERRQFFLENASLFGFGVRPGGDGSGGSMAIQPFFSRTIGLDGNGTPRPIDAGARMVYRSNTKNFGAIMMRQRAVDESPLTNFFVGRYSQNFGDQSRIGGMITAKQTPSGVNVVSTMDGFMRLTDAQSINMMAMHSNGGNSARQGYSGIFQYVNLTNHYKIWLTQSYVSKDFNPEMGFVSRKDIIGTTPGMNWYYRGKLLPFRKSIRAFEPGFLPEFYWQASTGELIERQLPLFPLWVNFQKGGYLGYSINPVYQRLTESFRPLGVNITAGEYNYFRQQIWMTTDPSKFLNLMGQLDWGTYFNGKLTTADFTLQLAPSPHLSIATRMNRNIFSSVGTEQSNEQIDLYGIEGRLALNPRVQVIGFYQQNSENDSKNYNIRLSWEYRPLSFLYIVLNKRGFRDLTGIRQEEDHSIIKLSYLRQL
ncbi:MAG: carbohydrate binding family 9 domain-containing protein [Cyclobacteriaceae bacterium]